MLLLRQWGRIQIEGSRIGADLLGEFVSGFIFCLVFQPYWRLQVWSIAYTTNMSYVSLDDSWRPQ
jgi:dolichol kinase